MNGSQLKAYLSLEVLDLSSNNIMEIQSGCFPPGLYIRELILSFNNLTGLDEKSLAKLGSLSILHLSHNSISHIAEGAFKGLKNLRIFHISSDSFLCDCQLKWLPPWLESTTLQAFVTATCAQPESLKGQSIFSVPPERFVCGKTSLEIFFFSMKGKEARWASCLWESLL
ncbi:Hypothetical predicted protein [Marmota monax]|uniref:LRRCT domain-containing protein n=1 Tax=Marmota monax TaxID=9995 RepID=A0A5E4D3L7_MARMO|nr:Hypothetical predicted protein [Marmota monax]